MHVILFGTICSNCCLKKDYRCFCNILQKCVANTPFFCSNHISVDVIFSPGHAYSKQSGHQIKGGHSASSPALMAEHTERKSLQSVKYWSLGDSRVKSGEDGPT